jgi:hypothetical protein
MMIACIRLFVATCKYLIRGCLQKGGRILIGILKATKTDGTAVKKNESGFFTLD